MSAPLVGTTTITWRSFSGGSRGSDGRYVDGFVALANITVSVQNLTGEEAATLASGERAQDWRKIYVEDGIDIHPTREGTGTSRGDQVDIGGETYEVRTVQTFGPEHPIPGSRVYVRKVQL